jgi:hypothetical protein
MNDEVGMVHRDIRVLTVGRAEGNHIAVIDPAVSGVHARLYRVYDRWFIEDCRSTNGTFVAGVLLPPGVAIEVLAGQPILLGTVPFSLPSGASAGARCSATSLREYLIAAGALPQVLAAALVDTLARELSFQHANGRIRPYLDAETVLVLDGDRDDVRLLLLDACAPSALTVEVDRLLWAYAAPEQFQGRPLNSRRDVYGLGVLAYEMLTGRRPFDADTPWAWATQHMTAAPPRLPESVAEHVVAAIDKALAKAPEARQSSVCDFYQEFAGAPVEFDRGDDPRERAPVAVRQRDETLSRAPACLSCGTENTVDARYCSTCGVPRRPSVEATPTAVAPQLMSRPPHERRLVVVGDAPARWRGLAFLGGVIGLVTSGPVGAAVGAAAGAVVERSMAPGGWSKLTPTYVPLEVAVRELPLSPAQIFPGCAYVMHPLRPDRYFPIETFHQRLFVEKCTELHRLLCALGASRVELRMRRELRTGSGVTAEAPVDFGGLPITLGGGLHGRNRRVEQGVFVEEYEPSGPPRLPDDLLWYDHVVEWQGLFERRTRFGATKLNGEFTQTEDFGVSLELKAEFDELGLKIGGNFENLRETVISYEAHYPRLAHANSAG